MSAWIAAALALNLSIALGLAVYAMVFVPQHIERRIRKSVRCFSEAIEARFPSHSGLTQRVTLLSVAIGKEMQLNRRELFRLELAARIRDIGLCAIPYQLVNDRSKHSWSQEEFAQYFCHSRIAAAMLAETRTLHQFAPAVLHHHDDYRDPRSGELTPLMSRILCLASEYAWLESTRGEFLAQESIRSHSGTRFDPEVVRAWSQVLTSSRGWERVNEPVSVA